MLTEMVGTVLRAQSKLAVEDIMMAKISSQEPERRDKRLAAVGTSLSTNERILSPMLHLLRV
jgi:hypothetical protein